MGNDKLDVQTSARLLERAERVAGGREALGERLGVSAASLGEWTAGKTFPPQEIFEKVLEVVLGIDAEAQPRRSANVRLVPPSRRTLRALVADNRSGFDIVARMLGDEFELVPVDGIIEAVDLLQSSAHLRKFQFDVILCAQHFAGSQMMDFLKCVKAYRGTSTVPFIAYRLEPTQLSQAALLATRYACEALGALTFLDPGALSAGTGAKAAAVEFRHAVRAAAELTQPVLTQRVLVVDDNRDAAHTLAMLIQMAGHSAEQAASGAEALRIGPQLRPTVIVLDLEMPGMSGMETARRMRVTDWGKSAFIIAVTGYSSPEQAKAALEAGFDRYFTKPVAPDALLAAFPGAALPA